MLIQCKSLICNCPPPPSMAPPPTFQIKGKLDMLDGIGTKLKVHINVPVYENRYIRTGQVTTRKNLKCQYIFHFSTYILPQKCFRLQNSWNPKRMPPPLENPHLNFLCKLKGTEKREGKLFPFIPSIYIPGTSIHCLPFGSICKRAVG